MGAPRGSGTPASVTASPSCPCRSIKQQEPVFKRGCPSSFLLGFLLLSHAPFSAEPKISRSLRGPRPGRSSAICGVSWTPRFSR